MNLRPYQARGIDAIRHAFAAGSRRVLAVAPTGAGKGVLIAHIASAVVARGQRAVVIVHRREIILDLAERIRRAGVQHVGVIMPGHDAEPFAPVQVASTQTLAARAGAAQAAQTAGGPSLVPVPGASADLVILDEAHHYAADEWARVVEAYPSARVVGFTATPQRRDGRSLGDMFEKLVVVAHYSELIDSGHIVPCRVYQPEEVVKDGLARDPVDAYELHAPGSLAFCFVATVEQARETAAKFVARGIPAETVTAETPAQDRKRAIADFAAGRVRVLVNVYTLTEGVDVPAASTVILARSCSHVSPYLQMAGRALRSAPGKTEAVIIDLSGASLKHGPPTEDRLYSLDGDGIRRVALAALKNCLKCGATVASTCGECPECGWEFPSREPKPPTIYSLELREVWAGANTPSDAKRREWDRLLGVARERGFGLTWASDQYRKTFAGELPPIAVTLTAEDLREEYVRLALVGHARGFKPGFAAARYREAFGRWPAKGWRLDAADAVAAASAAADVKEAV